MIQNTKTNQVSSQVANGVTVAANMAQQRLANFSPNDDQWTIYDVLCLRLPFLGVLIPGVHCAEFLRISHEDATGVQRPVDFGNRVRVVDTSWRNGIHTMTPFDALRVTLNEAAGNHNRAAAMMRLISCEVLALLGLRCPVDALPGRHSSFAAILHLIPFVQGGRSLAATT